MISALD